MAIILDFPRAARRLGPMVAKAKELSKWRVSRLKGNRAEDVATVEAPDAETAIALAVERHEIKDAWRLAARRI